MVDSLKIFEVLKTHLPESQARTVTHAIQQAEGEIALDVKSVVAAAFAQCATKAELKEVRAEIAETKAEMIKWMFVFWVGQLGATLAIVKWVR